MDDEVVVTTVCRPYLVALERAASSGDSRLSTALLRHSAGTPLRGDDGVAGSMAGRRQVRRYSFMH